MGTKEPPEAGTPPEEASEADSEASDVADAEEASSMAAEVDDEAPTPLPAPAPERIDTVLQEPLAASPTEVSPKRLKHDPREVRRLVAMAFSTGELSKFAERWRVFIDREGSVDDGARALVRALEARGKLHQLVESLRAHKPLFEWPEPSIEVDEPEPAPPPPAAAEALAAPADPAAEPAAQPAPKPAAAPSLGERDGAAPIVDPYATRPEPASSAGAEVIIPKRWLIAGGGVAALLILVVIVVLATTGGDEPATATVAAGAADELTRSVQAVRSACNVDTEGDSARDELTAAFRRCSVPTIRPSRVDIPLPARPKPAAPQPLALPKPPPGPVSRRPACLDQCHQIHNQCKASQCGSEPASAAAYETYQRCLASCLSQYSRCRLTCR